MIVLSPFIPDLCHSDWLFHGESCPRFDVVHPGRAWPSSPSCTWHCSLHYLFLPSFLMVWPKYASFLALTVSNSSLFTPALSRTHSFVFFAVHETRRILLSPFISKASRRVSSFFLRVQLSQATLALSLVVSSLKSVCCDFSISFAMTPRSPALCLTWWVDLVGWLQPDVVYLPEDGHPSQFNRARRALTSFIDELR